jgi:hypothetical protein
VNCNQARTLLSAYRELKSEKIENAELDAHLQTCATCREVLARYTCIGEQLRSAPAFAPPPELHARLMKALADEQLKFLQKSPPGKASTPEFLKPYLQERAEETQHQDDIAAFSTAETGPLPQIHSRRTRRRPRVHHLAVLGMAAAILILLMMGGLTSLLVLTRSNPVSLTKTINSVNRPIEVDQKSYTTTTLYPNVASVLPQGNALFYSASGTDGNSRDWMLMQFDRSTQTSRALLATPASNPLIVLAVSDTWLVWLEYSNPPSSLHGVVASNGARNLHICAQRAWSLHYLSLQPQTTAGSQARPTDKTPAGNQRASAAQRGAMTGQPEPGDVPASLLLEQDTFDSGTAPVWVTTPVQGTWLIGDRLLVAHIDRSGHSRLESFLLGQTGKAARVHVMATAPGGHVFAWPTAIRTGLEIYWADEWLARDGTLHSNIWQQQTTEQAVNTHGPQARTDHNTQRVYLGDGLSFQPQIVNDTLFFLSTSEISVSGQGVVTPNGTPFPVNATDSSVIFTPRTDTGVYSAPADALVHGTIFMIPLDGSGPEDTLGTVGQSTGLQAGSNFVIWQDSSGFQMYDIERQAGIFLGNTLNGAALLVVNGNTTLWLNASSAPGEKLTLMAFNWPN